MGRKRKVVVVMQENMPAISRNMLPNAINMHIEMVGIEKMMNFTLGYGPSASSRLAARAREEQVLFANRTHTSLSGLRILIPSDLSPSSPTTISHATSSAISWTVCSPLSFARISAPASRSREMQLLFPPEAAPRAAQCNAVRPS
jgi:hypothetical protein